MTLANGAALLFMQSDKLVLSKLMPLDQFGYYTLAWTLAGVFYLFYSPVSSAFLPRFSALLAVQDTPAAARLYHLSCQLVAVGAFPTAAMLVLFPSEVVAAWARNPVVVAGTAPLLQLLVPFSAVGCLVYMPTVFQWASGWTALTTRTYTAGLVLMLPSMLLGYTLAGAAGAIVGWGIIRLGQSLAQVEFMHLRLLQGQKWRWYRDVILRPAAAASAVCLCCRLWAGPKADLHTIVLGVMWALAAIAAFLSSPIAVQVLRQERVEVHPPSESVAS